MPPAKVVTVLSGVDEAFFGIAARRRPEPLLLCVSTLHPHKNLDGLLRAFARFRREPNFCELPVPGPATLCSDRRNTLENSAIHRFPRRKLTVFG